MKSDKNERGFNLLELMVVIGIVMALASVAIVQYRESQLRARETAAVQHVQTVEKAQAQFYAVYRRYAATFAELEQAGILPEHFSKPVLGGYKFDLKAETDAYLLLARPETFGKSGKRSFRADESLVVRQTDQDREPAPKDPPI